MSIIRATVKGEIVPGVQTRNVFTYSSASATYNSGVGTAIQTRLGALYGAFDDWISAIWEANTLAFEQLEEGVWQPKAEMSFSPAGVGATDMMPAQMAVLFAAFTGFAKTIGKKYIPAVLETVAVDGTLVAGCLAAFTSGVAYYMATVDATPNGVWTPGTVKADGTFHPFVSAALRDYLATQRRRKPGVGI